MKNIAYTIAVLAAAGGLLWASGSKTDAAAREEPDAGDAGKAEWLTDFEAAKREAAERNVPILADFSGSDWCGWCIKLDSEVFGKEEFTKYASKNLVLFVADFPAQKPQPEALKEQNKKLAAKYEVKGFPTVLVLDAKGEVMARTGYRRGGAEQYVEHLKEVLKK